MTPPRSIWWLVSGTILVAVFAPTSLPLAGLTYAGLQLVGGTRSQSSRAGALLVGVLAVAALVVPRGSASDGVVGVFQLFTAVAFVAAAWATRGPFLRRATGALAWGGAGAIALTWFLTGAQTWGLLAWDTLRQVSFSQRSVLEVMQPDALAKLYTMYEPVVRFLSTARPALEILGAYAALAAVWQWHVRTARTPLGPALRPFREFRLADGAIWGVVAATVAWVVSAKVPGLRITAVNAELVLGTLYLLRGAAVLGSLAAVVAIPAWVQAMAVVSGVLFAAVTAPSLWLLGVSDTWLEFRRRLESRPN
jgi:hypothetical protein